MFPMPLPYTTIIFTLACIAMVLLTIDIVVRELQRRSPDAVPRGWITLLMVVRVVVCILFFAGLAWLFASPIGVFVVLLAAGLYVRAIFARRHEETESVNQLIRLVSDHGGSLPDAIETFAPSCSSVVHRRCRDFAYRLRCGMDLESSARKSRLSLMPDTVIAIQRAALNSQERRGDRAASGQDLSECSLESELRWLRWPVSGQLLYLVALTFFSALMGSFLLTFIYPTFQYMSREFTVMSRRSGYWMQMFDRYWYFGLSVLLLLVMVWLTLVIVTAIHPSPLMTRLTPWFGSWVRQHNRWTGLRSLASGLYRGEPLSAVLDAGTKTPGSRWIRWRSRNALVRVQRGESSSGALQLGGWISRAEAQWLNAAEANNALPQAMDSLASQIWRRHDMLWQLRLSWLVPLVTVAISLLVFAQAVILFLFLVDMVYAVA
jgi:type II secretory pathway component PulF